MVTAVWLSAAVENTWLFLVGIVGYHGNELGVSQYETYPDNEANDVGDQKAGGKRIKFSRFRGSKTQQRTNLGCKAGRNIEPRGNAIGLREQVVKDHEHQKSKQSQYLSPHFIRKHTYHRHEGKGGNLTHILEKPVD
jgi:hypothetical protein